MPACIQAQFQCAYACVAHTQRLQQYLARRPCSVSIPSPNTHHTRRCSARTCSDPCAHKQHAFPPLGASQLHELESLLHNSGGPLVQPCLDICPAAGRLRARSECFARFELLEYVCVCVCVCVWYIEYMYVYIYIYICMYDEFCVWVDVCSWVMRMRCIQP
jgi:hypothetical protein